MTLTGPPHRSDPPRSFSWSQAGAGPQHWDSKQSWGTEKHSHTSVGLARTHRRPDGRPPPQACLGPRVAHLGPQTGPQQRYPQVGSAPLHRANQAGLCPPTYLPSTLAPTPSLAPQSCHTQLPPDLEHAAPSARNTLDTPPHKPIPPRPLCAFSTSPSGRATKFSI